MTPTSSASGSAIDIAYGDGNIREVAEDFERSLRQTQI